jgi:5-methylcytosine-specific restriction endonuclease McrA
MSLRRARLRGVEREDVDPLVVFERDKWRCHMCNRKVRKDVPYPSASFATLDHLIPLSAGGPHTYANIATACFPCNTRKGTRAVGEQLALIG